MREFTKLTRFLVCLVATEFICMAIFAILGNAIPGSRLWVGALFLLVAGFATAIGTCFIHSGQKMRFYNEFAFYPYIAEEGLRDEAQDIVNGTIEKQRQSAQEHFKNDEALAEERRALLKATGETSGKEFLEKQQKVLELDQRIATHHKAKAFTKGEFWHLVRVARWWGYATPNSINQCATGLTRR